MLRSLRPDDFVDETFGLPTVTDILQELEKPGRDPRPAFKTATFKEGVEKLGDLASGMVLEGVVTNVAAFGAFVDVGVHQDGLVHVSAMSKTFVKDPRDVVKPGDIVKVKVLDVDIPRKRISLTLRLDDEAAAQAGAAAAGAARAGGRAQPPRQQRRAGSRAGQQGRGGGRSAAGARQGARAGEQCDGGRVAAGWAGGPEAALRRRAGAVLAAALRREGTSGVAAVRWVAQPRRWYGVPRVHPRRPSGTTARSCGGTHARG